MTTSTTSPAPANAIKSWDSVDEYLNDNPTAWHLWATLQHGHRSATGHDWKGTLRLTADGIVQFSRTCCRTGEQA